MIELVCNTARQSRSGERGEKYAVVKSCATIVIRMHLYNVVVYLEHEERKSHNHKHPEKQRYCEWLYRILKRSDRHVDAGQLVLEVHQ